MLTLHSIIMMEQQAALKKKKDNEERRQDSVIHPAYDIFMLWMKEMERQDIIKHFYEQVRQAEQAEINRKWKMRIWKSQA